MPVIHGTQHLEGPPRPVLTIGNFDGVHLGHRALVQRTIDVAKEVGAPSAALTFHPAPQEVLRPQGAAPRLQSLDQRVQSLLHAGLELVIVEPFTRELGALPPPAFAEEILGRRLGVRALVLGHDFRFGRGRAGDASQLRGYLDVPVSQVEAILEGDTPISSSRIRRAVQEGDVGQAAALLGRPHEVRGRVGHGDKRGRELGFPTANLEDLEGLLPAHGVYAVRAEVDGIWHPAVANIGQRPTFQGHETRTEVHLLDFNRSLYGISLKIAFVAHLRAEQRFDSLHALTDAIAADVAAARGHLQ